MMAKQSLVSPVNSVLLQVLKTMWHGTTIHNWFFLQCHCSPLFATDLYFFFLQSWEDLCIFNYIGANTTTTTLCASTAYYQVQLSVPIFSLHWSTLSLSTILQYKHCKFTPSIFSIPQLLPTSEIYFAFIAVWDMFCLYSQELNHASNFLACISPMNFWTEVSRA